MIWVFLDGVGLGPPAPERNPLAMPPRLSFEQLGGGNAWTSVTPVVRRAHHVFLNLDAALGIPGLPQSGTGQATLFTGVNCAEAAGRHWGPFPHSTSKPIIEQHSIFERLKRVRKKGRFVNAFPERFFRAVAPRDRWTVTTRCCVAADVPLLNERDLRAGRAIAADLTGRAWRERLGLDVPVITQAEAGRRLVALADEADLTLFEYYETDKAGHSGDHARAAAALDDLDQFFEGMLEVLDPDRQLLVVTSDHGNIEDLSQPRHTLNPVPLVAYGSGASALSDCASIVDVTPRLAGLIAEPV